MPFAVDITVVSVVIVMAAKTVEDSILFVSALVVAFVSLVAFDAIFTVVVAVAAAVTDMS